MFGDIRFTNTQINQYKIDIQCIGIYGHDLSGGEGLPSRNPTVIQRPTDRSFLITVYVHFMLPLLRL